MKKRPARLVRAGLLCAYFVPKQHPAPERLMPLTITVSVRGWMTRQTCLQFIYQYRSLNLGGGEHIHQDELCLAQLKR